MLVFFGAGQVTEKLIKDGIKPNFILDNNPELNNTSFRDIPIYLPNLEVIKNVDKIIICTTSISEVEEQLKTLQFSGNIEIAKVLHEMAMVKELFDIKLSCYISSGLPSVNESSGGGIYKITEEDNLQVEKIYSANTHGLIKYEEGLAFTCQGEGIVILNEKNRIKRRIQLPYGLRPHGIQIYGPYFVVACSSADKILIVDINGDVINEFSLSSRFTDIGSAQHHCNDVFVDGHNAFVSMFSVSGNWKNGIFDGGIIQINLETGEQTIICNNLKMPHSVTKIDGVIHILNSYTGEILGYDFETLGSLTGFTRGFDVKNGLYYVGESRNRNFSKLKNKSTFASVDSRITMINPQYKISRSVLLPNYLSEIHAIVAY